MEDKAKYSVKHQISTVLNAGLGDLILIRGLPGSGKTTLAKVIAKELDCVHMEMDQFWTHNGVYKFEEDLLAEASFWCLKQTEYHLQEGKRVVVSNTFAALKEMSEYFILMKRMKLSFSIILCQNNIGWQTNVPLHIVKNMQERFADSKEITNYLKSL